MVFPKQFSIDENNFNCVKFFGLTTSNEEQDYSCEFENNTIYTKNLFYPDTDNVYIWIIFNGIKNPSSTITTDTFKLKTYDSDGNTICKSKT